MDVPYLRIQQEPNRKCGSASTNSDKDGHQGGFAIVQPLTYEATPNYPHPSSNTPEKNHLQVEGEMMQQYTLGHWRASRYSQMVFTPHSVLLQFIYEAESPLTLQHPYSPNPPPTLYERLIHTLPLNLAGHPRGTAIRTSLHQGISLQLSLIIILSESNLYHVLFLYVLDLHFKLRLSHTFYTTAP